MKGHLRHLKVFSCTSKELSLSTASLLVTKRSGKTKTKTLEIQKNLERQKQKLWIGIRRRQRQSIFPPEQGALPLHCTATLLAPGSKKIWKYKKTLERQKQKLWKREKQTRRQTQRRHLFLWQTNSKTIFLPFAMFWVVKSSIRSAIVPTWWR